MTIDPTSFVDNSGIMQAALASTDESDDGTDPDPDMDDDPDEMGENDPTPRPVSVTGIAKTASPVTANGNGTFTTTMTLVVENLGNIDLVDIDVNDNLTAEFGTLNGAPSMPGEYFVSTAPMITVNLGTLTQETTVTSFAPSLAIPPAS